MSKTTYHVVAVKQDDFFIFRNSGDVLFLLDVRPCSSTDAVLYCTKDMVDQKTPGRVTVEEFPTDFLFRQLVLTHIPFHQ